MAQLEQHLKWTYSDLLLFPDDGKRHELIDGEHIVSPSPFTKHQRILVNLTRIIGTFLKQHPIGQIFVAPMDVVLSDFDVVEPDLLFIASEHASIITEKHIMGVPDWVIEILSVSSRKTDEIIKRKLYEHYGVQEYWIVDPELEMVKTYRMIQKGYIRTTEISCPSNEILTTPLLSGMEIKPAEIFE